jgi:phosphoglycolate phosphatase-like HAD superfamily hydrolase
VAVECSDEESEIGVSRSPLPCRRHQLRGSLVFPVQPEPARSWQVIVRHSSNASPRGMAGLELPQSVKQFNQDDYHYLARTVYVRQLDKAPVTLAEVHTERVRFPVVTVAHRSTSVDIVEHNFAKAPA